MSILTKDMILKEMQNGNIIIDPAPVNIGPNSVDLRLGKTLKMYDGSVSLNEKHLGIAGYHYILDPKKDNPTVEVEIPEEGYVLVPGILYLGSTYEYTETHNYLPDLDGRSSIGRLGINIHCTAGRGDVGFCGNWTLELSCVQPVKVYPLMVMMQITYHKLYGEIKHTYLGRYQGDRHPVASRLHKG